MEELGNNNTNGNITNIDDACDCNGKGTCSIGKWLNRGKLKKNQHISNRKSFLKTKNVSIKQLKNVTHHVSLFLWKKK